MKTAKEILVEEINKEAAMGKYTNIPYYGYPTIFRAMEAYASQFQSPERVSEEESERCKKWTFVSGEYVLMLSLPKERLDDIDLGDCIISVFKDRKAVIQTVIPLASVSTPSEQEAIAFWEWAYDNGYRYMSDGQSLDAEGKTVFSNELYQLFKSAK